MRRPKIPDPQQTDGSSQQHVSGMQTVAFTVQQVQGSYKQTVLGTIFTGAGQHTGVQQAASAEAVSAIEIANGMVIEKATRSN